MKLTAAKHRVTAAIGGAIMLILGASPASAEDPPPFLLEWGSFGAADGQFNSPGGIGTDSLGNVYVSDIGNNRVQKFDANGTHLLSWGSVGAGNGQFAAGGMRGLAVGPGDEIYVVDAFNIRVQVFNINGVFQRQFSLGPGGLPGGFFQTELRSTPAPVMSMSRSAGATSAPATGKITGSENTTAPVHSSSSGAITDPIRIRANSPDRSASRSIKTARSMFWSRSRHACRCLLATVHF